MDSRANTIEPDEFVTALQIQNRLDLALWHAREAICRNAVCDVENEDYHLEAAREWLAIGIGSPVSKLDACAVIMRVIEYRETGSI